MLILVVVDTYPLALLISSFFSFFFRKYYPYLSQFSFPEEGQYGLDIYTREVGSHSHHNNHSSSEKHLLTHCCKYLINSSKRN